MFISRAEQFARFIIENKTTIRKTADYFHYSKSTVHNDVSNNLPLFNYELYIETKKILNDNFAQKHIRGGLATKRKYEKQS